VLFVVAPAEVDREDLGVGALQVGVQPRLEAGAVLLAGERRRRGEPRSARRLNDARVDRAPLHGRGHALAALRVGEQLAQRRLEQRLVLTRGEDLRLRQPDAQQVVRQLRVGLDVLLALAALQLVERRLREEKVPAGDQLGHVPEEERQQRVRMCEPSTSASVITITRW
jgi:hypothetical protein